MFGQAEIEFPKVSTPLANWRMPRVYVREDKQSRLATMGIKFVSIDEFDFERFASENPQLSGSEWQAVFVAFLRTSKPFGPKATDFVPPTDDVQLDAKLRNMEMPKRRLIRNIVLSLTKPKQ